MHRRYPWFAFIVTLLTSTPVQTGRTTRDIEVLAGFGFVPLYSFDSLSPAFTN